MFVLTLICLLLMTLYAILITLYRWAWTTMPVYTPPQNAPVVRITVLVPARNEEKNIASCLDSLARQTYPRDLYEVIVIDDHSTDTTAPIVKEIAAVSPMDLTCISLAEGAGGSYKKFAIRTGVSAAKGTLIVTTDADCWFEPDWLRTIAAFYKTTGAKFIAAPVRIGKSRPGLLYLLQTLDFITLQGITAASVYKRSHSMCNGANLAYEKNAFEEVDGFSGIDKIPSGDDMLLMYKIYKKYPEKVFFLKNRSAIVTTHPERTWKGFVNQRIRWASKAATYDDRRIFWVLLLVYTINALFPLLLLASCWNRWWLGVVLVGWMAKTMVEYPFVRSVARFFGQQRLMIYFPFLQPFHILYTVVVGWLGQFGSYKWKDRNVRKLSSVKK